MSEDYREDSRRERDRHERDDRREGRREREGRDDRRDGRREREGRSSRREREDRRDDRREFEDDRDHRKTRSDRDRKRTSYDDRRRSASVSPPPIKRKRPSQWDVPPPQGYDAIVDNPSSIANLNNNMNPHLSRQARRLYVGNVPETITEVPLAEFFNEAFNKAGVFKMENPVIAVQMDTIKSFAFLEFSFPEDATAGMSFDGIVMGGNSLKIRRPKDYKPTSEGMLMEAYRSAAERRFNQLPNLVSTNVAEGPNKIFIGGLPSYLTEDQVKELISSFGPLKSFNLVKDNATGNSKGFAFFEYLEGDVTDKACQGLNGMKLGEKTILVQRASLGAKHMQPTLQIMSSGKSILHNETAKYFLNLAMPIAAAAALLGVSINNTGSPTRILQIANVISAEQTLDNDEYNDILADIQNECGRYGHVVSIHVPKSTKKQDDGEWVDTEKSVQEEEKEEEPTIEIDWGVGKAFIEFQRKEDAAKAQAALAGRKFNNRHVLTGFYSEDLYHKHIFTANPEEEKTIAERIRQDRERREEHDRNIRNIIQTSKQDVGTPPPQDDSLPTPQTMASQFQEQLQSEHFQQ